MYFAQNKEEIHLPFKNSEKQRTQALRSNFHVDDLLKSVKNEEIAVTLIKDVKALYAEGGFHLTKFVSNSKHFLLSIPEDRRKGFHDQELRLGTLPTETALSIHWDIQSVKCSQW